MKLLRVIGTLDPAYGGPVEALRHMTVELAEQGHTSEIVVLDDVRSAGVEGFPAEVHALGRSHGKYRFSAQLVPWLSAHAHSYDAVVVHGIWQYQSFGVWRAAKTIGFPYFVFVHGALDPWFKRTYPLKHLKKWLYWPWAEYRVLRDASAVLFTTEDEQKLARESFWLYRANEAVVSYGIRAPEDDPHASRTTFLNAYPELSSKRILLFLSRIHRKKGCDLLIKAFAMAAARESQLHLVMAGPDQGGLQADLMNLARQLQVAERITWTGMLTGDMKSGAFRAGEAFVLPSHSENFGVAVIEALAHGMPVLTTDKVNIWRELVEGGAGLVGQDTEAGIGAMLNQWLSFSSEERIAMASRAKDCFSSHFDIGLAAEKFIHLVRRHVGEAGQATNASLSQRIQ